MWKHKNFIKLQLWAGPLRVGPAVITVTVTVNGESQSFTKSTEALTWEENIDYGTGTYTIADGKVLWNDGTILQYNGVDVLPTDDIVDNGAYTTRSAVTNYLITDTELTAIADAARAKAETTDKLTPAQIAEKINNLKIVANIDTADKMAALLVAENEGNVYKYVGTTTTDYINGDLYVVEAAPSSEETWVLNETLALTSNTFSANFTANNSTYTEIWMSDRELAYGDSSNVVYATKGGWIDEANKTLTFATAPTGDLLTWLQANGTEQGGTTGHTLTFSGVTVKVDGTPVTSPYALTKDCTIVATANTANYEVVVTAGSIEHHTDVDGNTLALADTDINIAEANVGATKMNNITISYTAGGEVPLSGTN